LAWEQEKKHSALLIKVTIEQNVTITELLRHLHVKMQDMVSVKLNAKILRRNSYNEVMLEEADQVEFLYFIGGGYGFYRTAD